MHRWTKEEVDFLYEFAQGHYYREIAEEYKNRFGSELRISQIKDKLTALSIKTGVDGRFKKGESYFRSVPIGTETKSYRGYINIKVDQPNKWQKKHRFLYEKYNGVKLKKGEHVIFLDRNINNFDVNNLVMITSRELFFINKTFDFDTATTELRKSRIALAKANVKLMDAKRSRKG